jgi:hypothetical protein
MAQDWELRNPTLETQISENGPGFEKVWKVPYKIVAGPATGTEGYVHIPAAQYTADFVGATVAHAVKVHNEVMSLPSDPRSFI